VAAAPSSQPGIAVTGLVKSYGPVKAVRGIDLSVAPGETVAILGPNGAGKSTTIDMVLGLIKPDAGGVSLFGMTPEQAVRSGVVGGMLQTGTLLRELSVRELVEMVASLYPKPLPVDDVLDLTGVASVADRRTHKLSGGQTQRVRLAVALVANPDLLVLDEPTAALDVSGRRDLWQAVAASAAGGKTVVFATHYLEEADEHADRIILLAQGRIVADGPATEIKAKVGGRTIRATLPEVDRQVLAALPGVTAAERHGDAVVLRCFDSDVALREFLVRFPAARDIEVRGAGLEEAFLELTGEEGDVVEELRQ
jgi:ABC-2 type transport system ATP-binding protein